jgi:DNA invertase Pin-like site-specific DNA recombinase
MQPPTHASTSGDNREIVELLQSILTNQNQERIQFHTAIQKLEQVTQCLHTMLDRLGRSEQLQFRMLEELEYLNWYSSGAERNDNM